MIDLKFCRIALTDFGCITYFHDGAAIGAHPHETPHYSVIAHRLGYQDDLLRYCREHEIIHSIVAEWFSNAPSPVLWALAHGEPRDPFAALQEEAVVQLVQRWVRAGERPIIGEVDWDGLKERCLGVLG